MVLVHVTDFEKLRSAYRDLKEYFNYPWQEKKPRGARHWFRSILSAFCVILVVLSFDYSFLETEPTSLPFTFAEHMSLIQGQVTPAHLDEARGLQLYDLVQELLSNKSTPQEEVGDSCCHHDDVVCRAKALFLHSIPEGLASYWTTAEDLVEQQEEQEEQEAPIIDIVGFVLEHEFLIQQSIDDDDKDSTPTSDVFQWVFDWLSGRPIDDPTPSEATTTTPVEIPTPTIFPLDTEGHGPQENPSPASDEVCPIDDSIVAIVVQALHQVDKYIDEHASSGWCHTATSINAAWALPFCFMF
jgi:hypothetical protein